MHRLNGHIKNYAWGKNGDISEVAKLFSAGHPEYQPKSDQTYAELWMGTHPDGPARLRNSSEKLSSLIARFNKDHEQNEVHLPFIMKIMSIKHTLSLQVHPTKVSFFANSFVYMLIFRNKQHGFIKKIQLIIRMLITNLNLLML